MYHITRYPPDFLDALIDIFANIRENNKFDVGVQVAQEMALAYIFDIFNSRVALLKRDENGNFLKLSTMASTVFGNTTYAQKKCN